MPFLTRLTFTSGDRVVLDEVVGSIKRDATHKGVEFNGPHNSQPVEHRIPQAKRLAPDGRQFDPWHYTVYSRTIEIVGHDAFTRATAERDFPPGVHVDAEIDQVRPVGTDGT